MAEDVHLGTAVRKEQCEKSRFRQPGFNILHIIKPIPEEKNPCVASYV